MKTIYHIALNGAGLSSLDDTICILDIIEEPPVMHTNAVQLYGGGQRILRQERESLSVQVFFSIQEPDPLRRGEIFRRVLAWADPGGILTLSGRTGQQLQSICTGLPALHAEDWTETLRITFSSAALPCWEDAAATSVTTEAAADLSLPGNTGRAPADVQVINCGSAAMTRLTLVCGDTRMVFTGLEVAPGASFVLQHAGGILTAEAGGESQLRRRTADSSDLLLAPCGMSCPVSVSADQPVTATFSARGRYM